MKKVLSMFVILVLIIISGCRYAPFGSQSVIDWVDFIKWNGKEYDGINTAVLADEKYLGEKLGEVKFKVADNVTNPHYKIRNGDAAFHEKGSEIFSIKGQQQLIAVKSSREINRYEVYFSRNETDYKWHFKDLQIEKVNRIELFQSYTPNGNKQILELNDPYKINDFLDILKTSEENPKFQPNTEKGDPLFYELVLYTDEPLAYKYSMQHDGHTYYWYPWDTFILSDAIKNFLPVN
jgi:hypothetical protein